jgi:hypothetical protein
MKLFIMQFSPASCFILSFFFFSGSTATLGHGLWFFQFYDHFTDGRTPWTSDQPVARPLPKHRTTQIQNTHIHIPNIHNLCGIRTHDPGEDTTCLRSLGYRDRHFILRGYRYFPQYPCLKNSLCSPYVYVWDRVSHPYKITGKITWIFFRNWHKL